MTSPDPIRDALLALLEGQAAQGRQLNRIARKVGDIVALTAKEQTALDHLTATIDAALAALQASTQGLKDQIAALTALRDQLQAANAADEAQLATLTASITALQGTLDSQEADVVNALGGLDAHVKTLGGV
jgi:chromosome segregation ATPase